MARNRLTQDDLIDRAEILDVLMDYAIGIDSRDWTRYRSIFTDEVKLDFSSWSGNAAAPMAADDWVAGVRDTLSGFDGTQHMLMNPVVELDGDRATVTLYMNAHHYLNIDGAHNMHSIGGYYSHHMVRTDSGWLSEACKLTVTWESGDRALFGIATDRWAAQSEAAGD
jgi:hypothetical protein